MGVPPNHDKSSMFIGFSIINIDEPSSYWGTPPIYGIFINILHELFSINIPQIDII